MNRARSLLFVPGDRPDRFDKATRVGADVTVIDLEDAVDPSAKDAARAHAREWLSAGGQAVVRVNAAATPPHEADLDALAGLPGLLGALLPKAESSADVANTARRLGVAVIALIESGLGLHRVHEIAAARGLVRLAFGSIDLSADIGAAESRESLLMARSTVVLASRVAHLTKPIDGVTTSLTDLTAVTDDARYARGLGFGAKLCIHPSQVAAVHEAFRPTADELRWAHRVLATSTSGATRLDDQMIDKAVVELARGLLEQDAPGES